MIHRFAPRYRPCLALFAVVTVVACRKAPPTHPEPTVDPIKAETQTAQNDLTKFQGKWKHLSIELNGQQAAPAVARDYFYHFEGTNFRNENKGQLKSKGTFVLDNTKTPAWIDQIESTNITLYGIYRFDEDRLTLCFNERQRPSTFASYVGQGTVLLVLERDVPQPTDFPESSLSPGHATAAKELQGMWTVVSFHSKGESSPVKEGHIIPYTFEGNKLITVGPLNAKVEMEFRLDPSKNPKRIDQRFTGGRIGPWIAKGIYKVEGGLLTICHGGPNISRPTDFTTRPGDGLTMTVNKRVK
jgi:uncharacterized protein (TIGR03067 family)